MVILNVVMTLVMIVLVGLILKLPDYITKSWLEQTKNRNAHDIQVESYFKQLGGEQQQEVLSKWTEFLTDLDKTTQKYNGSSSSGQRNFKKLIHDTVVYGSDRTVNLLSNYSHSVYEGADSNGNKMLVYVAYIITSLKSDFSGYKIEPLTLLKLMIKDYDDLEEIYSKYAEEIEQEIQQHRSGENVWNIHYRPIQILGDHNNNFNSNYYGREEIHKITSQLNGWLFCLEA